MFILTATYFISYDSLVFFNVLSVRGYRHVVPCLDTGRIIKLENGHFEVRNYLLIEVVLGLVRENKV